MTVPPDPAPRLLPLSGGDLLLMLIISLGAMVLFSISLSNVQTGPDNRMSLIGTVFLLLVQTTATIGAAWLIVIRRRGLTWASVGLRQAESRWYVRAVAIGGFMVPVVALVNYLIGQVEGHPFENPQVYAIAPEGFTWAGLVLMTAAAGVLAPIAEEIAFRGVFFAWLRERVGLLAGVAISALTFASLHGVVQLIPSLAVIGAVLAILYHRCGSLFPVIVAHGVFNTIMIVALYSSLAGTTTPS